MIPGSQNFPALIDLATPPSGVVIISGHAQSAFMGLAVDAGDINGDEIDDMVMSAPYLEHAEVYIIAGSGSLLPSYSTSAVVPGLTRIVDDSPFTLMGTDIASGDIDRDGMFDLVLGSPGASQSEDDGSVRIIHGMSELPSLVPASDDALRPKVILAEFTNGQLGRAVAIGHVDYDGRLDIAVSAPAAPGAGCSGCGVTYVLRDAGALPETVALGSTGLPITRLVGAGESTIYGDELTMADLDGDLRDDVVVGNYPLLGNQRARTVIAFAHALTNGSHALASDPAFTRIIEKEIGDLLGSSLATADLNKDGVDDLLIGAPGTAEAYIVNGTYAPTAVPPTASALLLRQNYPNPFNPQTSIPYFVPAHSRVRMAVFDASGQLIAALVDSEQAAGDHVARWDGRDHSGREVASGVYFCKLVAGSSSTSIKLVLVR